LHGLPSAASGDKHDVRRQRDQFVGPLAQALIIEWSPTVVEPQVATDGPAQRLQSLLEGRHIELCLLIVGREIHQCTDAPYTIRLLRARG
jgi:hypothetical protein